MLLSENPCFTVYSTNIHMRLVHLKTGYFDEKVFIALKAALALIEVLIDKVESPDLCNTLRVVVTFHLRHEGALGSKYSWSFRKLNHMTQKPS